ncbi:MAG TPA: alpha/beta fold hydrolase [Alphaproteobacteria bacterium]|nr:alpha/beta fold hydrolase [Planctomycetota bacterium]HIO01951.1 alpha/beta fold hydrolase [Alphaproteobacteria bacterium]
MDNVLNFKPHWGLGGANRQTIMGTLLPSRHKPSTPQQHTVTLADGEQLLLYENGPRDCERPNIVLVHGLGGCYTSGYMQRISAKLSHGGRRVFRVNLRGCGEGMSLARKTAHAGCSQDLAHAIAWIQQYTGQRDIAIAGFSLGANIMLRMLAQHQQYPDLSIIRAVAFAPPIDLAYGCQQLSIRNRGLYDRYFLKGLRRNLKRRRSMYPECPYSTLNPFPKTLEEFDDRFTAPLNGFAGAADYYQQSSSKYQLHKIQATTTIIYADDDPVVPSEVFTDVELSKSTKIYSTTHGGHLGYVSQRLSTGDRRWMDSTVIDLLTENSIHGNLC